MATTVEGTVGGRVAGRFNQGSFRIYRGKKTGDGSASSWELSLRPSRKTKNDVSEVNLFLTMAPQTGHDENGNANFDWKVKDKEGNWQPSKSITAKLGLPDIGEILTVLNGVKGQVGTDKGLFHAHPGGNGNTVIYFSVSKEKDTGNVFGYNIRLSTKNAAGEQNSVSHSISLGEGEVLRTLLNSAIIQINRWEL